MCLAKEGDRHQGILEAKQLKEKEKKKKRLSYCIQSTRILVLMTDYISLVGEEFPYGQLQTPDDYIHTLILSLYIMYLVDTIDASIRGVQPDDNKLIT